MKILKEINRIFIVFIVVFLPSFKLFASTNDVFIKFKLNNIFQEFSNKIIGIFGIFLIFSIAFLLSNNKKKISI